MSAAEALHAAYAAGIMVTVDAENLVLEASAEPPQALLNALLRHKPAILDLLRPKQGRWTAKDWQAFFNERRADIAKFDGELSRGEVDARAFEWCVVKWLSQHPAPSAPGRCAWCGRPELPGAVVLPFGTEPGTHTWLHAECWRNWYEARKTDAIAALKAMGIRGRRIDARGKAG
jgi:hypothetical protein